MIIYTYQHYGKKTSLHIQVLIHAFTYVWKFTPKFQCFKLIIIHLIEYKLFGGVDPI
jgi:hypothetical protein